MVKRSDAEAAQNKSSLKTGVTIDLRSDTVTKPTPEMRRAMAEAEVGDDVYGEDPSVNRLQDRAAEIFGREAALFVPSGSMGNLIAIKTWTHHGNEVICEERGHINQFEMAAMSAVAGCLPRPSFAEDGILSWSRIEPLIQPSVYTRAQTGLISLENSANMGGGTVYPMEVSDEICDGAHAAHLPVHLDGARIFNAATALGQQRERADAKIRLRHVLPVKRTWRAGWIDARRFARFYCQGARLPENVRRRNAPGRSARGGGIDRSGTIAGASARRSRQCAVLGRGIGAPAGRLREFEIRADQYRFL